MRSTARRRESYNWGSRNMLSSLVKGGATYSYTYDATGRRLAANNAGNTTSYGFDGDATIASVLGGAADNYLNLGGEVLADSNSSAISIPLQDGGGSTIGLINSATGALTTQYTYDPAGNVTSSGAASSFPFLAGGAQHDSLTGLYAGEGNYYNPVLERAISLVGATSAGGGQPGLTGPAGDMPSGGLEFHYDPLQEGRNTGIGIGAGLVTYALLAPEASLLPVGIVAGAVIVALDIFDLLGNSHPWINPKLYEPIHSIQGDLLGASAQLMLSQGNSASTTHQNLPLKRGSDIQVGGGVGISGALEIAGTAELVGGGPEDPVADAVAIGAVAVGIGAAAYHALKAPASTEEDCDEEWETAREICRDLMSNPLKPGGRGNNTRLRGKRYYSLDECARGYVTEECGGNPIDWGPNGPP
jgi:YD repeat-containing protein